MKEVADTWLQNFRNVGDFFLLNRIFKKKKLQDRVARNGSKTLLQMKQVLHEPCDKFVIHIFFID